MCYLATKHTEKANQQQFCWRAM